MGGARAVDLARGQVPRDLRRRGGGAAGWFWEMRSYYAEGRQWLEEALQSAGQASTKVQAKAFMMAGAMASRLGDRDAAEPLCRRALDMYRRVGGAAETALALLNLG